MIWIYAVGIINLYIWVLKGLRWNYIWAFRGLQWVVMVSLFMMFMLIRSMLYWVRSVWVSNRMMMSMGGSMSARMVSMMVRLNGLFHELLLFGFANSFVVISDGTGGEEPRAANLEHLYDSCHNIKLSIYYNYSSIF